MVIQGGGAVVAWDVTGTRVLKGLFSEGDENVLELDCADGCTTL